VIKVVLGDDDRTMSSSSGTSASLICWSVGS